MWQAASVESSVASEVLKTILLILKGKPGEMEETMVERRRFSLDATNMMPVAVSDTMSVSVLRCLPDSWNSSYLHRLSPTSLTQPPLIMHTSIQHAFIYVNILIGACILLSYRDQEQICTFEIQRNTKLYMWGKEGTVMIPSKSDTAHLDIERT